MSLICTTCNEGWVILEGEKHCGFCGALAFQVDVEVTDLNKVVYLEDLQAIEKIEAVARIRNTGSVTVLLHAPYVEIVIVET